MWVVVRVKRDIDLIAAKMIVTEDEARLPRVRLEPPLTGPDGSEFFEREMHILYGASCIFVDAGAAAADAVSDQDGSYTATVATPFGVTVECNGESDDADEIKERAETIAASITPAE
jgi:hypothetical protein